MVANRPEGYPRVVPYLLYEDVSAALESDYAVEDPEGNRWTFNQHLEDVPPEAWGATTA